MHNHKKLALAIGAAFSVATAAHADVTIYGLMSGGVESVKATGNGTASKEYKGAARVVDNTSRIGFAGNEDLGNGLKAIWQVESGLRNFEQGGVNDKGDKATFGTRNTFVGLQDSRLGTLQAGYFDSAYKRLTEVGINTFGNTVGDMNSGGSVVYNRRVARLANSVHYTSPVWNGLQAGVSYGVDETRPTASNGTRQNDDRVSLALNYNNAGLQVAAGYDREGDKLNGGATADGQQRIQSYKLASSYTFTQTGTYVGLGYERVKTDNNGSANTSQDDYILALSQPLTCAWTLKASYALLGKLDGAASSDDYKARQWLLAVTYDLSKRTQLFAYGSKIANAKLQNANFGDNPIYTSGSGGSSASLDKGNDPQAFGVGMKISF